MKYNGVELAELSYLQWNGKNRKMLVWNMEDISSKGFKPSIKYVVGMTDEKTYTDDGLMYDFCSEIPYTLDQLKAHLADSGFDGVSPELVLKYLREYTKLIEKSQQPVTHHYTDDDFIDGEYYNCTVTLIYHGEYIHPTNVYRCTKFNGKVTLNPVDALSTCISPSSVDSMTPYKRSSDFAAMADQLIRKLKEWEHKDE